jgi:hypothetical protein
VEENGKDGWSKKKVMDSHWEKGKKLSKFTRLLKKKRKRKKN